MENEWKAIIIHYPRVYFQFVQRRSHFRLLLWTVEKFRASTPRSRSHSVPRASDRQEFARRKHRRIIRS